MKRILYSLVTLAIVFLLAACGNRAEQDAAQPSSVTSDNAAGASDPDAGNSADDSTEQTGDVDLTTLSSTMVYAEVYNMMCAPQDYIGRNIKMSGQFSVFEDTASNQIYYACVIADATACCQQGIEFVLADETLTYPDDYPALGETVTVMGEFQTYEENGYVYCHLVDAEMIIG